MNYYQLAINELQPVLFNAENRQLNIRLNNAFIDFTTKHNINKALLYVHHPVQGWCQVCDNKNTYLIINNPLTLDYGALNMAIIHTLAQANLMLDEIQKRSKKEQELKTERNTDAEIKRRAFYLVK